MGTDGPRGRARVRALVDEDIAAALETARAITDPWYRCQALSNVAEHLSERKRKVGVLDEAFAAADETRVRNRVATVASLPLRVLATCEGEAHVLERLRRLLDVIAAEPHPIRRMDGQVALLSAVSQCQDEVVEPALSALLDTLRHAHGWRRDRTLAFVAQTLLLRGDPTRAWPLLDEFENAREGRRATRAIVAQFGPRPG